MTYKNLTKDDINTLNLTDEEANKIDSDLSQAISNKSPCRECSCGDYENGIPTTKCRICGHSYTSHI